MLPALIGQLVVVLKDSALGVQITYLELLNWSKTLGSAYANTVPAYVVAALLFITINWSLTRAAGWVERRLKRTGATAAPVTTTVPNVVQGQAEPGPPTATEAADDVRELGEDLRELGEEIRDHLPGTGTDGPAPDRPGKELRLGRRTGRTAAARIGFQDPPEAVDSRYDHRSVRWSAGEESRVGCRARPGNQHRPPVLPGGRPERPRAV